MKAESGWVGFAVGAAVGTLGWVVGLGNVLWPEHPEWALLLVTIGVALGSVIILEKSESRSADRAQI